MNDHDEPRREDDALLGLMLRTLERVIRRRDTGAELRCAYRARRWTAIFREGRDDDSRVVTVSAPRLADALSALLPLVTS